MLLLTISFLLTAALANPTTPNPNILPRQVPPIDFICNNVLRHTCPGNRYCCAVNWDCKANDPSICTASIAQSYIISASALDYASYAAGLSSLQSRISAGAVVTRSGSRGVGSVTVSATAGVTSLGVGTASSAVVAASSGASPAASSVASSVVQQTSSAVDTSSPISTPTSTTPAASPAPSSASAAASPTGAATLLRVAREMIAGGVVGVALLLL
jgi:hypothetical protein